MTATAIATSRRLARSAARQPRVAVALAGLSGLILVQLLAILLLQVPA